MSVIEKVMSEARLIRHSATVAGGRRPEASSEIKTVMAAAIMKRISKALLGETYSPVTEYAVFAPLGTGLEYYDILRFDDGRSLRITSAHPIGVPDGSAIPFERYTAEETGE